MWSLGGEIDGGVQRNSTETTVHDLPDDALAAIFRRLQPPRLASAAWPAGIDSVLGSQLLTGPTGRRLMPNFYRDAALQPALARTELDTSFHDLATAFTESAEGGRCGDEGVVGNMRTPSSLLVAAAVCRRWQSVVTDNVVQTWFGSPASALRFPSLRALICRSAAASGDFMLLAGACSQSITKKNSNVCWTSVPVCRDGYKHSQYGAGGRLHAALPALPALPLRTLAVVDASGLSGAAFAAICRCTALTSLHLGNATAVPPTALTHLAALDRLRRLDLPGPSLRQASSVTALADALLLLPPDGLLSLDLSGSLIGTIGAAAGEEVGCLAAALVHLRALTRLLLRDCGLASGSARTLARFLPFMPCLLYTSPSPRD